MDSLIDTFHIDLKLLLAQSINFAIVVAVLYFFALKPLVRTMKDRTATIEKSLDDAKKIEQKLAKTENEYKATVAQAKKEANEIIIRATEEADAKRTVMLNRAKDEIGQVITEEKQKIRQEKEKMFKEVKKEVADLVIDTTEKVLGKKLDEKGDREYIKKIIK